MLGEKNGNWKGDKAGYKAIHKWLTENYPKTGRCVRCKEHKKTQYALIEENHVRHPEAYLELCVKCHTNFDRGNIILVRIEASY